MKVASATPVNEIKANNSNVYSTQGSINVIGADGANINIYSLAGTLINGITNAGSSFNATVPAGIYVVVVDGISTKVVVK